MLVFLLRPEELAALAVAVIAHELGHLLALLLFGVRLEEVSFAATGPVLYCAFPDSGAAGALAALSGPIAGALFFLAFRGCWALAAEMSFVLTAVNLLPVLPLDGGRALSAVLRHSPARASLMRSVRFAVLAALALFGTACLAAGWGCAPLLLALWLLVVPSRSCKSALNDVKYSY